MDKSKEIFSEYSDIVTVDEVMKMLRLGKNTVYKLLKDDEIMNVKVGARYVIPKPPLPITPPILYRPLRILPKGSASGSWAGLPGTKPQYGQGVSFVSEKQFSHKYLLLSCIIDVPPVH